MSGQEGSPETPAFRVLLHVAAVAAIVPLFLVRYLPMTDLPEHVATIATLRHWADEGWNNQRYFEIAGVLETPYWLYHVAGALLTFVTGSAERANLALLAVVGLTYPFALRALLLALRRDPRLALFGCALFWTHNLTIGLLNFVASVPLVLFGLALVVRQSEAPTRRRAIVLSFVALATLYLHLSAFALLVGDGILLTWLWRAPASEAALPRQLAGRLRNLPRALVWLLPSFACSAAIFIAGRAGAGANRGQRFVYRPRLEIIRGLPHWLFDCFRSRVDYILGWSLVAILVVLVVTSARAANTPERWRGRIVWLLFGVACLAYVAMPSQAGAYAALLDVRMAIFVAMFAVLLPVPRAGRRGLVPLAAVGALALALSVNVGREVRAFERDEVGNFDALLQQMPRGKRLLSLNFDARSVHVDAPAFNYFGSYYRARYGGIASFSFNEIPHWPVHYKASERPPGQSGDQLSWGNPCVFRNARDGMYFDFVLVHGARDPLAEKPAGPVWEMIGGSRGFRLYRRVPGETAPGDEDQSLCL
ncbi:MAG: 1,4-alpha-glucan (glycogen) branching enzyme GH3-type [Labilithrix sp.]|nr:1,4-alpha-glucan (glycogen) branching enzyme GH3-type [Labilithrix sp.]